MIVCVCVCSDIMIKRYLCISLSESFIGKTNRRELFFFFCSLVMTFSIRFGFCRVTPGACCGSAGPLLWASWKLLKGADFCLQGGSLAETSSPGQFHVLRKDRNRVESLPGAGVVELAP